MKYNLTEAQKEMACLLVKEVRAKNLPESFYVYEGGKGELIFPEIEFEGKQPGSFGSITGRLGSLDALAEAKLLVQRISYESRSSSLSDFGGTVSQREQSRTCTLTGLIYKAVDSNFADDQASMPISVLAQPHPPEIAMSLDRLRTKYPDPKKLGLLVMRFAAEKPFQRIVEVIKQTGKQHDLEIIRADENDFHSDLWGNVRTLLHGCGFGIAVYERIETDEPNANVGLEVGYLMAMNKSVLLLKDETVKALPSDLAGKLYKEFNPHDPEGTIPGQLTKWLEDNGIIVPPRK